ncbi:MAG: sigma-70 family RNA polymerase sigma factor [Archangium sp.]
MRRFRDGEDAAFDAIYSRHAGTVFGFLNKLTRDSAMAEDLVQITFTSMVRSRDRFLDSMKLTPWLFTIAANAARGVHRQKVVRERTAHEQKASAEVVSEQPTYDPGLRRAVDEALVKLPEAQREAVVMHKVQGMSFEEIAEVMGVSSTAARIKAHRGYAKLRELLAHLKD